MDRERQIRLTIRLNNLKLGRMLAQPAFNPVYFDSVLKANRRLQLALDALEEAKNDVRDIDDDMEGEREFMRSEANHRQLTEDERIIYGL